MILAANWVSSIGPFRLTSSTRSQSSSLISRRGPSRLIPALFTRMSMPPRAATAAATACRQPSIVPTSPGAGTSFSRGPSCASVFSTDAAELPFTATRAPALRNSSTVARPTPRVPPVTNTRFPSNSMSGAPISVRQLTRVAYPLETPMFGLPSPTTIRRRSKRGGPWPQLNRRLGRSRMILAAAAAVGEIPHVRDLLPREAAIADQRLGDAAIDMPAPALAAARPLLSGRLHGKVVGLLLRRRQRYVVIRQTLLRQRRRNVIGIRRDFAQGCVFL